MPYKCPNTWDPCMYLCGIAKVSLALASALIGAGLWTGVAYGATWDYRITNVDTPTVIDATKTSAAVNTTANEITLSRSAPQTAAFFGEEDVPDFVVLSPTGLKHYSFDGSQMVENTIFSVNVTSPLAAFTSIYPDSIVSDGITITHYSMGGSNPSLSLAGLVGVAAIGARENDIAFLSQGQLKYYAHDGFGMVELPMLSINTGITNPVDFALAQDTYDAVVLEPNQVKYFSFTGSEMAEVPALAITGLVGAKAISNANGDVALIEGNKVKHYSLSGSCLVYNDALSLTTGLTAATCVALKPGSNDRIIVDGDEVKYYQWDGSQLVYNPLLSVTVAGLKDIGAYSMTGVAIAQVKSSGVNVNRVRVRAYHLLPEGTSITWSVTADGGTTWIKRWRVQGLAGGVTICEVTPDNGTTWNSIGEAVRASPAQDTAELWTPVTPGADIAWKADLATANAAVTPKIRAPMAGNAALIWEASNAPNPPGVTTPSQCYVTTTPTVTWTYNDDDGDLQSSYQVQIKKRDETLVLDTGKVANAQASYAITTSAGPDMAGPLWSSGEYEFRLYIKVWDTNNLESEWSSGSDFCVVGFERPRIAEIVSPPSGQTAPDPGMASTHIVITPGMTSANLPRVKAGARVKLIIDSVGPLTSATSSFPYGAHCATVDSSAPLYAAGNKINRWTVDFWTDSSLELAPTGTVVGTSWAGTSTDGTPTFCAPPYATGVVRTEDTVLIDWIVMLKEKQ